jgi:UDP-N-acetylmuramate dehydrogenase
VAITAKNSRLVMARGRLERFLGEKVCVDRSLANYTTMRVGGRAAIFVTADDLRELRLIMQTVKDYDLPLFILGRGSNLLVSDEGVFGIVMRLGRDFKQVSVDGTEITAGAAASLGSLVQTASRQSLAGLSFAVGIPGTLGAAIAVNAGAHGRDMASVIKRIVYYSPALELKSANVSKLTFDYRSCCLPKGAVILEANLVLELGEADAIKHEMDANWKRRKNTQPLNLPNAGSIFKNPPNDYAARLIEATGLKGYQIGGAQISTKHANFFVNAGEASAADFYRLINEVTVAVRERAGITLEPEIKLIGDWSYVES